MEEINLRFCPRCGVEHKLSEFKREPKPGRYPGSCVYSGRDARISKPPKTKTTKPPPVYLDASYLPKKRVVGLFPRIQTIFSHSYRARANGNNGKIIYQEWEDLKEKYNNTCLCCGRRSPEVEITLDHVLPLSMGGRNTIENAQPLCLSCNCKKSTKYIDYRP